MEFKPSDLSAAFRDAGLPVGRCFGSKSAYRQFNPKCFFIPNANIFCRRHGKIWWGDVDVRKDQPALEKVAHRLRSRLYVLRESDGRFENAGTAHRTVIRCALWHTGGATRVPGLHRFLRRSGLELHQLALLTKIRPVRLTKPQQPEVALEVYRRLADFDELFAEIAVEAGHKQWGYWWTTANEKLGGESPMAVFKSGRSVPLGELLGNKYALRCYCLVLMLSKRL